MNKLQKNLQNSFYKIIIYLNLLQRIHIHILEVFRLTIKENITINHIIYNVLDQVQEFNII